MNIFFVIQLFIFMLALVNFGFAVYLQVNVFALIFSIFTVVLTAVLATFAWDKK